MGDAAGRQGFYPSARRRERERSYNSRMNAVRPILDRLRAIVGPSGFLDQPADVEPFTVDHRKLYRGATPLVLRPANTAEVAAVLRVCNDTGVGVVPVGGNTGYCGGATPS